MRDALFHLPPIEGVGLQAQVREMLVSAILSRRLAAGEAVPSSRGMAAQLGVSRNTVTLAYQQLVADGYLEARERSGYRVAADAPVADGGEQAAPVAASAWDALVGDAPEPRRIQKPLNWREYRYPFVYGQADPRLFDHSAWRDCARQAMGLRNFEAMAGDKGAEDDPLLVDYIRARTLPRRGVSARAEEVLVTGGAQNALWLIARLLADRGVAVGIEEPGYPDLREALLRMGVAVRTLPVDEGGLVPDEARMGGLGAVFVTPSHHAPTNATMPLERRRALLDAASRLGFVIVEDDYDFELGFLRKPEPALKSLDAEGRVAYVGSFAKSLFPGLRLGYLVAPERVVVAARGLRTLMLRHPPGLGQRTAAYFLALGHHDAHIRRLQGALAKRRAAMDEALTAAGLDAAGAGFGGASFWLRAPDGLDTGALAERLRLRGVLIEPGAAFYAGEALGAPAPSLDRMRLGYGSIDSERIGAGVALIAEEVEAMRRAA